MGPGVYEALGLQLGLDLDRDATASDLLDSLLAMFRDATGVDLEQDVLDWMTGGMALALLPSDLAGLSSGPPTEALNAAALVQFDGTKRDNVVGAMADITGLLESALGLQGDSVSYGGGAGAVFDLSDLLGAAAYNPGYLVLGEHVVIATTAGGLQLVAATHGGQGDSLAEEPEYARLVAELSGTENPLIYINVSEIREAAVAALDPDGRREYQENVEPFVQPFKALLMAGNVQEGVRRFSVIVTIE